MNEIQVISREAIPPIQEVEQGGIVHELGELRDFRWNDQLRDFMPPPARFSVSWVRLQPGEVLQPHVHPIQSMMVVYASTGEMLGDLRRPIGKDDVIVVPPGCVHGFVGGPGGLAALSIQFGEGLYTEPEKPRVVFGDKKHGLAELLAHNERRVAEFQRRPIFDLLADGTLEDPKKRKAYLDYLQIWVNGNQSLLFSRQASCSDPKFQGVFLKHMREEIGHEVLHTEREGGRDEPVRDAVMEAITNWFTYQMYVLDNVEKTAIIHLVIENGSEAYHRRAKPVLSKYMNNKYFELHVEADAEHAAMGVELLKDETPQTYASLQKVIDRAWDMVGAMTDRVVELTRSA